MIEQRLSEGLNKETASPIFRIIAQSLRFAPIPHSIRLSYHLLIAKAKRSIVRTTKDEDENEGEGGEDEDEGEGEGQVHKGCNLICPLPTRPPNHKIQREGASWL